LKIGIFVPNWIGDTAMSTPTLRALRRHFGSGAELVGIMRPYVSEVLAGTPWLDDQIMFHRRSPIGSQRMIPVGIELRR
jgi:heptosyltransferase-2